MADRDQDEIIGGVPVEPFTQSGEVRVVADDDGKVETVLHLLPQVQVAPAQVLGELYGSVRCHNARGSDPYPQDGFFGLLNQRIQQPEEEL